MASLRLLTGFEAVPTFLAPSLFRSSSVAFQSSSFSTTTTRSYKTDKSKKRGVSALRRTGPKYALSMSKEPLPQPVLDPAKRSRVKVSDDHGLWQFFGKDKKPLASPELEGAHGRSWVVEELRGKSFDDLHCLWWTCVKERNRIRSQEYERQRVNAGYGENEANTRDFTVRKTMRAIKHALTERWYAWDAARKLADQQKPTSFMEEAEDEEGDEDARDSKVEDPTISEQSSPAPGPSTTISPGQQPTRPAHIVS